MPAPLVALVDARPGRRPEARAVLAWFWLDLWRNHRAAVTLVVALSSAGAVAQATGLGLLAKALSVAVGGGVEIPYLLIGAPIALFGLAAQLNYRGASRAFDLTEAYLARVSDRLESILREHASPNLDKSQRRTMLRLMSSDLLALGHAVRSSIDVVQPAVIALVSVLTLVTLNKAATIVIAALALPYLWSSRRLIGQIVGTVREIETSRPASRGQRERSLEGEQADRVRSRGLYLLRRRLEARGRWLTETFVSAGLGAALLVLFLGRSDVESLGPLSAYLLVLRQGLGSVHGISGEITSFARYWPALRRHHEILVHGMLPPPPSEDGSREGGRRGVSGRRRYREGGRRKGPGTKPSA